MSHFNLKISALLVLLFGLFALNAIDVGAQTIDRGTQRNGMHSCPTGQFVVGVHVDKNWLQCSGEFGSYSPSDEIIDRTTIRRRRNQVQGMHTCPVGMAMTGLHVTEERLACAPVSRSFPRFVDIGTQRSGMHICAEGSPVSGIHVNRNLFLCGTSGGFNAAEFVDAGTQSDDMHSCPNGRFVVGVHTDKNLLLCSSDFGNNGDPQIVRFRRGESGGSQPNSMLACPEGMAMTGLHVDNKLLACARVAPPPISRVVDARTQRSGMHACKQGSPVSGIDVRNNLLLCGTEGGVSASTAEGTHDFTVWLAGHSPFGASKGQTKEHPWWTGSYPTGGTLNGNLIRVANPRNSVWLGFIKSNYGSNDCGKSEAYVLLEPGATLTEDQMQTIFGSSSPTLPVAFVVCSGAVGKATPNGGLTFPSLPLNITYSRR